MDSENAIQNFLCNTQNGDTPMFEIDINKYRKYATASGTYEYDGRDYSLEFPVNPETYRRPFWPSFWDKFDAKRVNTTLLYHEKNMCKPVNIDIAEVFMK